jgi:hypothetical protein
MIFISRLSFISLICYSVALKNVVNTILQLNIPSTPKSFQLFWNLFFWLQRSNVWLSHCSKKVDFPENRFSRPETWRYRSWLDLCPIPIRRRGNVGGRYRFRLRSFLPLWPTVKLDPRSTDMSKNKILLLFTTFQSCFLLFIHIWIQCKFSML